MILRLKLLYINYDVFPRFELRIRMPFHPVLCGIPTDKLRDLEGWSLQKERRPINLPHDLVHKLKGATRVVSIEL